MSLATLKKQNAASSKMVIDYFKNNSTFLKYAREQTQLIVQRDKEDDIKLDKGIQVGIERGTIKKIPPRKYTDVNVLGRTPEDIAQQIVNAVTSNKSEGSVIVLVGLSGTGKGTTVAHISDLLPNCITWSNGNIFRAFTLLACKNAGEKPTLTKNSEALSADNIESYTKMIKFDYFDDRGFDIKIEGLGYDIFVNDVKNTLLKSGDISRNIPTVAELTQGEAIQFAKQAIHVMKERKINVLLEGRQQTVDFIDSNFRYCLKLSDKNVIGMRRVAQILAATALKCHEETKEEDVALLLQKALEDF